MPPRDLQWHFRTKWLASDFARFLIAAILLHNARGQSDSCAFQPDIAEYCSASGASLCAVDATVGESFRSACQTTCQVCKTRRQLDNELLEAGGTVEIRTGFVLDQGAEADLDLIKGFDLWLSHSGAGTDGIAVGNGVVKVKHFTEFADADDACSGHHAAARRLIEEHQIDFAIIQKHTCKTNLSQTYHEAGVIHFLQSGTPMVDANGDLYENKLNWYLHFSSDDYPRLFLKQMDFNGNRNVSVVYYEGHDWARTSAQTLMSNIQSSLEKGQSKMQVVHSYSWSPEAGGRGINGEYDDQMWEELLQGYQDSGAQVLVVYSIDEGLSLMKKVSEMEAPVNGVYITVAPTKTEWDKQLGTNGNYVVTPGQWSDMALSPCVVFGSISDYVKLFNATYGFVPNYNVAMSSFGGIIMQLAMQHAGSIVTPDVLDALYTLSYDTMMGRLRFSAEKRNIGRDPVLMQVQGPDLNLVLPAELAVAPLLNFVVWECRGLVEDQDPSQCSNEEVAVFEECFDRYRDRIDGTACLLRIEAERVKQWEGTEPIDVCMEYASASAAAQALAEYNNLGNADLLLRGCSQTWFAAGGFVLPKLKVMGGRLVISDLGSGTPGSSSSSAISISLPALELIEESLVIKGEMGPGMDVLLPSLATVQDFNVTATTGRLGIFLPKLSLIKGGINFDGNEAISGLQLPLAEQCSGLVLNANKGQPGSAGGFLITLPSLRAIDGGLVVTNNPDLSAIVVPQLEVLGSQFYVAGNPNLVELSFAVLSDIQGEPIVIQDNAELAFINLAQRLMNVTYCDTFAKGDFSGNDALLNIRTLWFEVHNCAILQRDDRANICAKGFVLVHGEGDESRCDQDWRAYFVSVLILAAGSIFGVSMVFMYQARQYRTFYCRPEFTDGRPIPSSLCNFNWHESSATLLLSTVDMVSDIIFIQVQIDDNACRDYRWIITASLWVLIISSAVSSLRVLMEVVTLSMDKHRYIHFFPIPDRGHRSLMNWAWCLANGLNNLLLVFICITGLEPLRTLPWDRPVSENDAEILKARDYMPDWHRFSELERMEDKEGKEEERSGGITGQFRARSLNRQHSIASRNVSAGAKLWLFLSTLSFFDQSIGITEDVGQFILQMFFLVSCHPSESAALTTLLSLMFSLLRAGLKLMSAFNDDIIKESVAEATNFVSKFVQGSARKLDPVSQLSSVSPDEEGNDMITAVQP